MASDPNSSLHDLCVNITSDLSQLQHGLATAGASPQALTSLSHMQEIMGEMTKVLAKSPEVEEAAKSGPAAGPAGPMAPEQPAPQAQPEQGPSNNTPGARGGPPPSGAFGAAAQQLHQAMSGNAQGAAR